MTLLPAFVLASIEYACVTFPSPAFSMNSSPA
jgi:hypothetical protein